MFHTKEIVTFQISIIKKLNKIVIAWNISHQRNFNSVNVSTPKNFTEHNEGLLIGGIKFKKLISVKIFDTKFNFQCE